MRLRLALSTIALSATAVAAASPVRAAPATCPHDASLGKVAFVPAGSLRLFDLGTCREKVLVTRAAQGPVRFVERGSAVEYGPSGLVVPVAGGPKRLAPPASTGLASPDGKKLAVVRDSRSIWITDLDTGEAHHLYSAGTTLELEAWSPDSRWLFFAPYLAASLAADGQTLKVVDTRTGKTRVVGEGLLYGDYRTWCGSRLVLTTGGDRVVTDGKRLEIATAPGWRARPLVRAPGRTWGSVACAPGSRSVVAQSQAQSTDANFFHTKWALWRVALDGSQRQLTMPPAGYADESPRWSRDGRSILFVRSRRGAGRLYLWRNGTTTGPLVSLGSSLGYYGHQAWWNVAAWSSGATP